MGNWNDINKRCEDRVYTTLNKMNRLLMTEQRSEPVTEEDILMFEEILNSQEEVKFKKYNANTLLKKNDRQKLSLKLGVAAAVVMLLIGTVTFFQISHNVIYPTPLNRSFQPGSSEAYLTLFDGRHIVLNDVLCDTLQTNEGNVVIGEAIVQCTSNSALQKTEKLQWNKIVVPRGGEYQLTLSDGTQVWLNSESELQFPIHFVENNRIVRLKGEAYFNVKSNDKAYFKVLTQQGEISVLGTEFNVNLYQEDQIVTTLVTGSIIYSNKSRRPIQLKPGEQLSYRQGDSFPRITKVNSYIYCSWKDNLFYFEEQTLEEIMYTLSRWYNFNYFFEHNEIREIKLSGKLDRYTTVESLLTLFEKSAPVSFEIKDQVIWIRSRMFNK